MTTALMATSSASFVTGVSMLRQMQLRDTLDIPWDEEECRSADSSLGALSSDVALLDQATTCLILSKVTDLLRI